MKLILLRHAEAVNHAATDFERVLTPKGREQAQMVGDFYRLLNLSFDYIVSSPYHRARETAELVAGNLGYEVPLSLEKGLGCGMNYTEAFDILRTMPDEAVVLLVGHQPDLGAFTSYLCGSHSGGNFAFKKACSAFFEVYSFSQGGGILEQFLPLKTLRSLLF